MPGLQLHQLRVAAVAKMVCDNFTQPVTTHDVVLAALFHDMGNIAKSDLKTFPEFLEPEGLEYWQKVKQEVVEKYSGTDAHAATVGMCKEIALPAHVIELIDGVRFSQLEKMRDTTSDELKILEYADQRVGPHGVLSLDGRMEEAHTRYAERKEWNTPQGQASYQILADAARDLERDIFSHAKITPTDITDASVAPLVEELWEYEVV